MPPPNATHASGARPPGELWHRGGVAPAVPERDPERNVPDAPTLSGRRIAALGVLAAAIHGAFDALSYCVHAIAPPYLRLWDGPEEFQMLSPVAVSIAASCVSGVIAVIAFGAVVPRQRRPLVLGAVVSAFWIFSAALLRAVWLATPWGITALALLAGIPRGLAVGWMLARVAGPSISGARDAAA